MTRRPTRLAVLGAGAWGIHHVRVVGAEPTCELALVVDHDPIAQRRARQIAPSAEVSADIERALGDTAIDAIVIATPAATHVDLACAALRAGKHVLVEKPLALSERDARQVLAAIPTDRVFMVGHLLAFHPAVVRTRELLRSGELGRFQYAHSTRANLGRIRKDETALWSFGPHELSMLDYLLEHAPISVAARGQCIVQPSIEDIVFMTVTYPDGGMAHMHLSRVHPRKQRSLCLVCSHGMVEFDDASPEKLKIYGKGYSDVQSPPLPMIEPLRAQLEHFLACIATGGVPRTDIRSALRITAALDAAQQSLGRDGVSVNLTYGKPEIYRQMNTGQ